MAAAEDSIEADFIVIGAGSAGCTVAARLSEDSRTSVPLLEAGGDDANRRIHIPLGFGKTFADPSVNWCYEYPVKSQYSPPLPGPGFAGLGDSWSGAACGSLGSSEIGAAAVEVADASTLLAGLSSVAPP
ncbi:MAG TPA: hypothetical protein VG308_16765 [Stellaceae bacterium]|nr:hypothetical protein [Stellaceae bacterium]